MRGASWAVGAVGTGIGLVLVYLGMTGGGAQLALIGCGVIAIALAVAGGLRRPDRWARSVFMAVVAFGVIAGVWWAFDQL